MPSGAINILSSFKFRAFALVALLLLIGCSADKSANISPLVSQPDEQSIYFFAVTNIFPEAEHSKQQIRFNRSLLLPQKQTDVWQLDCYDIPAYRFSGLHLQHHLKITTPGILIDTDQTLTLFAPAITYPLAQKNKVQAYWLRISPLTNPTISLWMAPAFSPDIAEQAQRETLRRARLTESMADDAYYFGYSSNDDALE